MTMIEELKSIQTMESSSGALKVKDALGKPKVTVNLTAIKVAGGYAECEARLVTGQRK